MIASRKAFIVVAAFVLIAIGLPWGGNVPAAFAQIQVTSANPDTGDQGTLGLNVTIGGKGFKKGAKANFYLKGTTNPAGITVRATKFVSDASLVATIDIAAGATPDDFDIVVANADGRTGKGTELFAVLVKVDPCTLSDPVPSTSAYLSSVPGFPGYLDSTFGNGTGRVIGPRTMTVTGIAADHNGRIVAAGSSYDPCQAGGARAWAVARYLPDGQVDTGFGTGGLVSMAFGSKNAQFYAIAIDASERIVVAGYAPGKAGQVFAVARYDTNGALDASFAGTGFVILPIERYTGVAFALTIQSDGKIVLAGVTGGVLLVVRVNQDGTLDATFNGSGQFLYLAAQSRALAVTTQWVRDPARDVWEERIVVAGLVSGVGTLWRFTAAGALDETFGTSGMVDVYRPASGEYFNMAGLAVDSSNRLIVGGDVRIVSPTQQSRLLLACYDESGNPVPTFGHGGIVSPAPRVAQEKAGGIVVQADGGIVVGGTSNEATSGTGVSHASVWRFTKDGVLDQTFGSNGWVSDPIAGGSRYLSTGGQVALQPDGRVIWASYLNPLTGSSGAPWYAVLARFWLW